LNVMRAIVLTWHQAVKFPGVGHTRSDAEIARKFYTLSTKVNRFEEPLEIDTLDVRAQDHLQQGSSVEAVIQVPLDGRFKSDGPDLITLFHKTTRSDKFFF